MEEDLYLFTLILLEEFYCTLLEFSSEGTAGNL